MTLLLNQGANEMPASTTVFITGEILEFLDQDSFLVPMQLVVIGHPRRDKHLWYVLPIDYEETSQMIGPLDLLYKLEDSRSIRIIRGGCGLWMTTEDLKLLQFASTIKSRQWEAFRKRVCGMFSGHCIEDGIERPEMTAAEENEYWVCIERIEQRMESLYDTLLALPLQHAPILSPRWRNYFSESESPLALGADVGDELSRTELIFEWTSQRSDFVAQIRVAPSDGMKEFRVTEEHGRLVRIYTWGTVPAIENVSIVTQMPADPACLVDVEGRWFVKCQDLYELLNIVPNSLLLMVIGSERIIPKVTIVDMD